MISESRNEKKLKAALRAKFRLKQHLERIDWDYDELRPQVADFLGKAQLPELPDLNTINVEFEKVMDNDNDSRTAKKPARSKS